MVPTTEYPTGIIQVDDDRLTIHDYEDRDPTIVRHFERITPEVRSQELHRLLVIGAWATEAAPGALTFRDIAEEVSKATAELQRLADAAKREAKAAVQLEADAMKRALADELARYCSADRTTSIPSAVESKVKGIVDLAEQKVKAQLDAALNVGDEGSTLGIILAKLNQVSTQVQVMMGRKDERRVGASSKGEEYQRAVFEELARIAAVHGDTPEYTAHTEGEGGNDRGDVTVTLSPMLTDGRPIRVVFEAMARESKNNSNARLESVLKELEEANRNRVATCAVAVASNADMRVLAGQRLARPADDRFVVLYSAEDRDPLALEVAYCLAKVQAIGLAKDSARPVLDLAHAGRVLGRLLARMDDFDKLQANLRDGQGALLKANSLTEALRTDLRNELSVLQAVLRGAPSAEVDTAA